MPFVPYGDADALRAALTEDTAAVFLEPTLGEGGVVPPPAGYLAAARAPATRSARCSSSTRCRASAAPAPGTPTSSDGMRPDVVTLAKGLGGGLPIGACIGLGRAATLLQPGDHGSTFGGNPVVCAAALAVLDTIEAEGLLEHSRALGERLPPGSPPSTRRCSPGSAAPGCGSRSR